MIEANAATRTEVVLGQAFGAEFEYYKEVLQQPDNMVLLKLGGLIVAESMDVISHDVQTLVDLRVPVVIVHGASTQIDENLTKQGITRIKADDGIRVTNGATLEVVRDTLITVNDTVTEALKATGIPAVSFSVGTFRAELRDKATYGYVGDVVDVVDAPIRTALANQSVPVVSCIGSWGNYRSLNVNADTASSALAAKLGVHKFMVLTGEGGILDRGNNIIPVITTQDGRSELVEELIEDGTISEGAIPKVYEIISAVEELPDSSSVVITHPESVIRELFSHAGDGTLVRKGDKIVHHPKVSALRRSLLRKLIVDSFKGTLDVDYFDKLPANAEVFATAQLYDGAAVIFPGKTEADPAYLDKIAVPPASQSTGVGRELITAAIARYPGGLYWRTNVVNEKQIAWYKRVADARKTINDWIIFMANVAPENRDKCIQDAVSRPVTITY